jgi:hypothetical protein
MSIVEKLEAQLSIPSTVRMHWTGCPNSCGQVCFKAPFDKRKLSSILLQAILDVHSNYSQQLHFLDSFLCVSGAYLKSNTVDMTTAWCDPLQVNRPCGAQYFL